MLRSLAIFGLLASGLGAAEIQPGGPELRQPQLAAAYGKVAMAYGSPDAIWFSASPDNGRTFSPAVKVASAGALALGRHRGPRVTILKDAILITAVVGNEVSHSPHAHGLPDRGELTVWRSTDGGANWARAGLINDAPAAAEEGLHAIAADAEGNLFAAWLDHRNKGTELWGSRSTDGGRTWSKNVRIYASPGGTICECCDPSIAIDSHGVMHIMWRNVLDGSRDLYLTTSKDGVHFSPATKVGDGAWKINACPMDGGGIALDHDAVVTAWRRESSIYLAQPGKPEMKLADGKDVAITANAKGVWVAWSTAQGVEALAPGATTPRHLTDNGGFPALVSLPDGAVLAAWEIDGAIRTALLQ